MDIIRHNAKGEEIRLHSAMTKEEFRLFDVTELEAEADAIRRSLKGPAPKGFRQLAGLALNRILDVIQEKTGGR